VIAIVLAVLAAGCNALSSVAQRKANRDESRRRRFGPSLLLHLLGRPAWLLGFAAMVMSFFLQAAALKVGTLSAVEPVLVLELPLALVLSAIFLHHPLRRRDWISGLAMAVGLAALIAALDPRGGHAGTLPTPTVLVAGGTTLAAIAALVAAAWWGPKQSRTALLGAAAGSGFGLTASLIKTTVARLPMHGFVGLFTSWETYALVATGLLSVGLVQAALNTGTLVAAQPGITLLDPLVALLWGTLVAGEDTRTGFALVFAAAGGILIAAAAVWLAQATAQPGKSG
jgi:drug/metabolite transporter (DMT)-like permease